MADTNTAQNTSTEPTTGAQTEPNGEQNTEPAAEEKKYTDGELNGIVKKKSEKAVQKFMSELGITDKEKAKSILAKAAEETGYIKNTQYRFFHATVLCPDFDKCI